MPYINEHDRVDFRIDLASVTICPIALEPDKYTIEDKFIDKLYKTFPPLLKDERVVEFIEILSKQYDETKKILLTPLIFWDISVQYKENISKMKRSFLLVHSYIPPVTVNGNAVNGNAINIFTKALIEINIVVCYYN